MTAPIDRHRPSNRRLARRLSRLPFDKSLDAKTPCTRVLLLHAENVFQEGKRELQR